MSEQPRISIRLDTPYGAMEASNQHGAVTGLAGLDGWHGGVSVTGTFTDRLGHGQFPAKGRAGSRILSLRLSRSADTDAEVEAFRRGVSAVLGDGESGELTVDWDGHVLSSTVQRDGEVAVSHDAGFATALIPLRAPDPFLYGEWRELSLQPVGAGVGFEFPPFSKGGVITFGSAVDTTELLWNDGNAESYPVFEVTADAPGGFVIGVGGKRVTYPWPVFKNIPVTVDMSGSVLVGGVDQSHLLGEREWSSIPPASIESTSFSFMRGGEGWAIARTRDTYI